MKPSKCTTADSPQGIHIAFAGGSALAQPTGMNIGWMTLGAAQSSVKYAKASDWPSLATVVNTKEAPKSYLTHFGFHHSVSLLDLVPSTRYAYQVGSDDGWITNLTFTTAPASKGASFSVSVFGDMGYEDSKKRPLVLPAVDGLQKDWSATYTRARLEALKNANEIDWVWHLGDIGYPDDAYGVDPVKFEYESVYNAYIDWLQNLTAHMPYMVSPGNHESECHSPLCFISGHAKHLNNFSAFNTRWHMPSEESNARKGSAMWYSFNYGDVHFVSINSETDWPGAEEEFTGDGHFKSLPAGGFGQDGEYLKWLEADLAAAEKSRRETGSPRFIIGGGHRPYSDIRPLHTDLFAKYSVDLYYAGHGHSYSRAAPVNGTTYIMVGGAGCDEMAPAQNASGNQAGVWDMRIVPRQGHERAPGYAVPLGSEVYATGQMATGVLTVNATGLYWRLVASKDGAVLDYIKIK